MCAVRQRSVNLSSLRATRRSSSPVKTGEVPRDPPSLALRATAGLSPPKRGARRRKRGGRGVGLDDSPATKTKRRVQTPIFFLPRGNGGGAAPTGPARSGRPDDRLRAAVGASDSTILLRRKQSVELDAPSTILRAARYGWSPSPAIAGADKRSPSRDAPLRPSFATLFPSKPFQAPPLKEGRRSADRRTKLGRIAADKLTQACANRLPTRRAPFSPSSPACAGGLGRGRARLSAPHRGIRRGLTLELGSGPRFLESPDANGRTLSGTSAASTSRSDHAPDGSMPRTARKQGDEPRPRDRPRSVNRPSPVTPFAERDSRLITETVTDVKSQCHYTVTTFDAPILSVMPALVAGIHVLLVTVKEKTWMAEHRRAKRRRPSDGYARP